LNAKHKKPSAANPSRIKKRPTDAAALFLYVQAQLKHGTWAARALAEVAFMVQDFDVPWPIAPEESEYAAVFNETLAAIEKLAEPRATLEDAFEAGRLVGRIAHEQECLLASKRGKPNTGLFNDLVVDLIRRGEKPKEAEKKIFAWMKEHRPEAEIAAADARRQARSRRNM
jgi:hypothetical protein